MIKASIRPLLFILPFLMVFLQSCQETKEYHVVLKVYNLSNDTIQFGDSESSALSSVFILPSQSSSVEVRKINATPYYDVTGITCYIAKNGIVEGQRYGERVVLGESHVILSFHWNGENVEFMN